jgi:hypothetical protein
LTTFSLSLPPHLLVTQHIHVKADGPQKPWRFTYGVVWISRIAFVDHRVKLLHYSGSRVAWVSSKSNHLLAFMKACTIIEAKNADRDFTDWRQGVNRRTF